LQEKPEEAFRKRFGYHVVYDPDLFGAIDFASQHGFGYIVPDLVIPRFFPERFDRRARRRIRDYAASKGVAISFHGPSENLVALYPEIRRAVIDRMKLCLDFAADVGAERLTIHTTPPPDFVSAGRRGTYLRDHWPLYKNALKESLREISAYASGRAMVCCENAPFDEMAMEVLEELLPEGKIFLAWDIQKGYTGEGKPIVQVEDFFLRHLQSVKECHLHDRRPGEYSHDILGVGKIDFSHYLRILTPWDVYFILEIRPRENAVRSLNILKQMLNK